MEISKKGSEETRIFNENKRVKVRTLEGEKFIGRFEIIDQNSIKIKDNIIFLDSISNIKSRSVVAGIGRVLLIITGSYMLLTSPLVALAAGSNTGLYLSGIGTAFILTGIFHNVLVRNQKNNNWTYKIIEE